MDYAFNEQMNVRYEDMLAWVTRIYQACGMDAEDAHTCADHGVMCDARGVYSHGCLRTPIYSRRLLAGGTSPTAKPEVIKKVGSTALVQGHNAMGQVVTTFAMKEAINMAGEQGSATVAVTGSNHLGACAYYAMQAADADMIGFCWTIASGNVMAPWGGLERQMGNNPFSIAIPCHASPHIVLDMAQSVVARGKVVMARKTKKPIPAEWAMDVDGNPTTDPEAGYWGTVQPMAGYKGYALAFMIASMTAVLTGSAWGPAISDLYEKPEDVQNTAHLLQVVNIGAIRDVREFKKEMKDYVEYVKGGRKRAGVEEILVPGEPEARNLQRQLAEGIMYPIEVIEEHRELSRKLGVDVML